jgi:Kef-type K+ transport system membrane component KefB
LITRIRRRIEKSGFFLFFLGLFLMAIGITQDLTILRDIGLVILLLILVTVIVRARRDVTGTPRRPRSPDDTKPR